MKRSTERSVKGREQVGMQQDTLAAPLVSVGIPVYNEAAKLEACVQYVLNQTYGNIEICISDNCSTDDTYDVAMKLASRHPNVRVIRQERNLGVVGNFDAVRRAMNGTYFMWLAADDQIYPTHIEKMVAELERYPRAAVAQGATRRVDDNNNLIREIRYLGRFNPNRYGPLRQAMLVLSASGNVRAQKMSHFIGGVYRKSIVDGILNQRTNAISGGDRMFVALAALSGGLRYVDEVLFVKHLHRRPYRKRWPDDPLNDEKKKQRERIVWEIISWVASCPTVPLRRRWYGFIIAAPFVVLGLERGRRVPRPIRFGTRALLAGFRSSPKQN